MLHRGPPYLLTKAYLLCGYTLSSEHACMGASELWAGLTCKHRMKSECQQLKWDHEYQGLIGPSTASGEMEVLEVIYWTGRESKTRYRREEICNELCMCCPPTTGFPEDINENRIGTEDHLCRWTRKCKVQPKQSVSTHQYVFMRVKLFRCYTVVPFTQDREKNYKQW